MRFLTPTDGQMVTDSAGVRAGEHLVLEVQVEASPSAHICINEAPAVYENGCHRALVELDGYRNTIFATDGTDTVTMGVYWAPKATNTYAFSIDDNVWWLQELAAKPYASVFQHPYLRVYHDLHAEFGTKFRFNVFYESQKGEAFNLSMMPDRYRDEFLANSDWLHLAFHARAEFPEWPYCHATWQQARQDYADVEREVRRFAGDSAIEAATTVHFCSANRETTRALRARGIRMLMGYMDTVDGKPYVSYYLSPDQIDRVREYGYWRDGQEDMFFGPIDAVLNTMTPEEIPAHLDRMTSANPKRSSVEIMIHEQYFYSDYQAYEPDYAARIRAGILWCADHGLRPVFTGEVTAEW